MLLIWLYITQNMFGSLGEMCAVSVGCFFFFFLFSLLLLPFLLWFSTVWYVFVDVFFLFSATAAGLLRCLLFIMFTFRSGRGKNVIMDALRSTKICKECLSHIQTHGPKNSGERNWKAQTNQVDFLINAHRIEVYSERNWGEKKAQKKMYVLVFALFSHMHRRISVLWLWLCRQLASFGYGLFLL